MNIVTLNDSPEVIAKAMGLAEAPTESKSTAIKLARLKVNNTPIMGTEEIKGKKVNIEKISGGTFRLDLPDDGGVYYKDDIAIKTFFTRYMYKKWDMGKNNFVRSVMVDSVKALRNTDVKDTDGGYNCGRSSGFMDRETYDALPENRKTLIKSVKAVRVILGMVNFDGATRVDGDVMTTEDLGFVPFVMDVSNVESFKDMEQSFSKLSTMKQNAIHFLTSIATEPRKLPNGNTFYVTKANVDLGNKITPSSADEEAFVNFQTWMQSHNQFVISKHNENAHNNESVDKGLVETFIDITSDEKVQ